MAALGKDGDTLEVGYLTPILNSRGKATNKYVARRAVIHLSEITVVDEYFDQRGLLLEECCRIYYTGIGWLVLEERYDTISGYKLGHGVKVIGFQQPNNNKNYGTNRQKRNRKNS
jgi:hypothetical protein